MHIFNTVSVEIGSLCNRKCWFCPNAYTDRPDEFMDMGLIRKVADELKSIDYKGRVELYQFNEPMRDKRLLDIIKIFRGKVPKSCIMLATNGDYIKDYTDIEALYKAGLNQLQINVYSNFSRFCFFQDALAKIDCAPGNVYSYCSPKKHLYSLEEKYDKQLTPASHKIGRFELTNRCGMIPGLPTENKQLDKLCPRPFRFLQINWKGEIILCCNDFHGDYVCGNVKDDKILSVWQGSEFLDKYRRHMLSKGRRGLEFCCKCAFVGAYPHMVPPLWKELLEK